MFLDGTKRLLVGDRRADERFRERAGPRHGRRELWRRTARLADDCRPAGDDDAAVGRGTCTSANSCAESIAKPDADTDTDTDTDGNTDADTDADTNTYTNDEYLPIRRI